MASTLPKLGWVRVGEINTHFAWAGQGQPLLLIHGGASDWREWKKNILALSQQYRVYAPDLPGFGLTPNPKRDSTTDFYGDFLHGFADALGLDRFSLIGHSMGGGVAWRFAQRSPLRIKKLVLVAAAGFGEGVSPLGRLVVFFTSLWRARRQALRPLFLRRAWAVLRKVRMEPLAKDGLPLPTLIVWGRWDIYLALSHAQAAHRLFPHSQLRIFPCGHAPQRTWPRKFNRLVLNFLADDPIPRPALRPREVAWER